MNESYFSQNSFEQSPRTQDIADNGGLGRGSIGKADRTRRSWSVREEEILICSLKDLVVRGWKSDNGFRSGYLSRAEEAIKQEFPNSDLKANPHINSKLTQWKKNYYSLGKILERSGVGFNVHGDYKIDCDNDQWEQIVKQDNNARFMRYKSWPLWNDWKIVFGKDRASGAVVEDTNDAFDALDEQNQNQGKNAGATEYSTANPSPQQVHSGTPDEASSGQSVPASSQAKKTGKKRKASLDTVGLIEMLGKMQDDTNLRLDKLTSRIGYEFDVSKSRKKVFELLGTIPGLSMVQQIDVAEIILEKVERIDLFMCLPEHGRLTYVMRALEKHGAV